eukprot:GILJ01034510.1.p1 GENE.GILJ01034510.1~~GILJ01034510.1.p1  ORF type:complete len:130 (+),score=2.46 GILJ01034510.1:144-533(+)
METYCCQCSGIYPGHESVWRVDLLLRSFVNLAIRLEGSFLQETNDNKRRSLLVINTITIGAVVKELRHEGCGCHEAPSCISASKGVPSTPATTHADWSGVLPSLSTALMSAPLATRALTLAVALNKTAT